MQFILIYGRRLIFNEEQAINIRLTELKQKAKISADTQNRIDSAMELIEKEKFKLEIFDNIIIRKLIECVKVISKEELLIIFKGGVEVRAKIE